MDGRGYLGKLIADHFAATRRQPPAGRGLSFDLSYIRGVAVGLVAAGALAQEQMDSMLADMEQALARSGWLTRRQATVSAAETQATATMSVAARREVVLAHARELALSHVDPSRLRQVISLFGRAVTFDEGSADLVSLERWSTMLVLRLAYPDPTGQLPHGLVDARRGPWRGWDDAGTQYRQGGASGSARHGVFVEDVVFEPGVPDGARTLTLLTGGREAITIALGAARE